MNKINVLGVEFDNISLQEAVDRACELISLRKSTYVVTPNPEIVMAAQENDDLKDALAKAAMVLPDGIGIIYGAHILRTPLKERVPGIDFASLLMDRLAENHGTVYLFGAKPKIAEQAAVNLEKSHSGLKIIGFHDGYFEDDGLVIEEINRLNPDLLLVCLGFPKQELWMQKNAGRLEVGLMAGLGGSLDVFAGAVQRAPALWQKLGLEWLYRLLKDPSRFGRMMKLPQFLLCVAKERVKK